MKYTVKVENKKVFSTNELNEALEVISAIRNHDSSMKRFGLSKYPYIADFLNKEEIYLIGGSIGSWNQSWVRDIKWTFPETQCQNSYPDFLTACWSVPSQWWSTLSILFSEVLNPDLSLSSKMRKKRNRGVWIWEIFLNFFGIQHYGPHLRKLHAFFTSGLAGNLFSSFFKPFVNFAYQRILVNRIVSGFPF